MALHRIRRAKIHKLAVVKKPASGHTWHLFKQAPDEQPDEPDGRHAWIDELTEAEQRTLLHDLVPETLERDARKGRERMAKRRLERLGAVAKSDPEPDPERARTVQRFARQHRELAARPSNPTGDWLYNEPTATAEQAADALEQLDAHWPTMRRPRWMMG